MPFMVKGTPEKVEKVAASQEELQPKPVAEQSAPLEEKKKEEPDGEAKQD